MGQRTHVYGMVICLVSALTGVIMVAGVLKRWYWAVAGPVMVGVLGVLYVAFWIGRALITTPIEPPADD